MLIPLISLDPIHRRLKPVTFKPVQQGKTPQALEGFLPLLNNFLSSVLFGKTINRAEFFTTWARTSFASSSSSLSKDDFCFLDYQDSLATDFESIANKAVEQKSYFLSAFNYQCDQQEQFEFFHTALRLSQIFLLVKQTDLFTVSHPLKATIKQKAVPTALAVNLLDQLIFAKDRRELAVLEPYKNRILVENDDFALIAYLPGSKFLYDRFLLGATDLHIHTTASDSSDSPQTVFERVVKAGLKTFAIADHDNMEAISTIEQIMQEQKALVPVFVPGVEISVRDERELHLLAYFPYGGQENFEPFLLTQQEAREQRNIDMISKLQKLGYQIDYQEFIRAGEHSLGRMQMALLLKAKGYVKTTDQAFREIIGFGCPGYIERPRPSLAAAIIAIKKAGGTSVLAHPALYGWINKKADSQNLNDLKTRFKRYQQLGLEGIEAFHGEASSAEQKILSQIAVELSLLRTAGSDDHGANKSNTSIYTGEMNFF